MCSWIHIAPVISRYILLFWVLSSSLFVSAQLTLSISQQPNHYCKGCSYSGGSILINEVMISPSTGDGSLYGSDVNRRGEWIELYNPDSCCPRDISCYYLGNNATDLQPPADCPGGFELPPGTIVPPSGFVIVRGLNAPPVPAALLVQNGGKTIEYIVGLNQQYCMGGGERLWFPNAGGWFAFYDDNGIPQDAIYWADSLNFIHTTHPCNPLGGCLLNNSLPSFSEIPQSRKSYISIGQPISGYTFKRYPDGGNWMQDIPYSATYGDCNVQPCPQTNPCNGSAAVIVTGGTQPYAFHWNDCRSQSSSTATGLCQGTYCVTVTDALGIQASTCITVLNMAPNVVLSTFNPVCFDVDSIKLTQGSPGGGYYVGAGINNAYLHPQIAGIGVHGLHYIVDNGLGCYGEDSSTFTVWPPPLPLATALTEAVCVGGTVHLMGSASGGSGSGYTYSWMGPGLTNSIDQELIIKGISLEQGGNYLLSVVDSRNCTSMHPDTLRIKVFSPPDIKLMPEDTLYLCNGESYQIRLTNEDTIHYHWQDGDTNYYYFVYNPGVYSVKANFKLCAVSDTIRFLPCTDFWVPNAFTPNLDNSNDVFLPKCSQDLREYQLHIFNRWGQLLFTSDNIQKGWDGVYKNEVCKSDIYIYTITYTPLEGGKQQRQGIVVLVR